MHNLSVENIDKQPKWAEVDQSDVQSVLLFLSKYGRPRLSMTGTDLKWHCRIEMFVTGEGICFEIKTDYQQATPLNAVQKCAELMIKALDDLNKKTPGNNKADQ